MSVTDVAVAGQQGIKAFGGFLPHLGDIAAIKKRIIQPGVHAAEFVAFHPDGWLLVPGNAVITVFWINGASAEFCQPGQDFSFATELFQRVASGFSGATERRGVESLDIQLAKTMGKQLSLPMPLLRQGVDRVPRLSMADKYDFHHGPPVSEVLTVDLFQR